MSEPAEPPIEVARKAIRHALDAICYDPRKYWLMGSGTQTYALLTEAHASLNQLPIEQVRETFVPDRRKYNAYCDELKEMERLQQLGTEHDRQGGKE